MFDDTLPTHAPPSFYLLAKPAESTCKVSTARTASSCRISFPREALLAPSL